MRPASTSLLVDTLDCRSALLDYFRVQGIEEDEPVALSLIGQRFRLAFTGRQISDELARMIEEGLIVQGGSRFGIKLTKRGVLIVRDANKGS